MSKPLWVKISGVVFATLLVLNMIFFGIGLYKDMIFWIALGVLAISSWILVKLAAKN